MTATVIHEEKIGELTIAITRFEYDPHTWRKDFSEGKLLSPSGIELISMRGSVAGMKRDLREEAMERV